ncbi:lipid-A-disaccharide synthase [Caldimonas thermodepolymerans]|jgi:lipid-A-disaccharide synthase|uniref:Lipid-A-disaccharide synthase n=2 Tax=Caldimonas thermodepolymerans TaxID=215580 RepID=A0AA46DER9_9BURK|nr:lipid-A-disaccharide synthase [Caldimonas thermodepolymerans]RDI00481.1 lipid-A-disaccharide synthase [Caldimonas thermodepolymerans]TCP07240.1 lipid-A-disaccharide synthase [Caldimonas thermodepolymerans]UZG42858.1 lipid-A-disaccharide synthase [Caldimonas thermodepolymerans]UZG46523.1 lipid-A-disaccharide synthase [Caldimonas thermodepolymerans]
MATGLRLAMVAGEASGDLLAGLVLGGMRQRWPDARVQGIGGPRMAEHGFEAWWPHEKLAVRGYVEVLRHYREIAGIRRQLAQRLLDERPDLFIGVDAPDFNLGLEEQLRAGGIRTIQFVCPSIWAWRGKRVHRIRRSADHVLCLFPFEPELLAQHDIPATYVGHPLADTIPLEVPRQASRLSLGVAPDGVVVALLPGSRRSEIEYNGPKILAAAAELHRRRPQLQFLLPVVPGLRAMVEPLLSRHAAGVPIRLLDGRSHEVLAACDTVLIASGTATLEAALFKKPMVITYSMHWLSAAIMRRMGYLPWVGLPNILCREFVVPELLQEAATPQSLADATLAWLDDPQRCEALTGRFTELHHLLRRNTAQAATDAIAKVLEA